MLCVSRPLSCQYRYPKYTAVRGGDLERRVRASCSRRLGASCRGKGGSVQTIEKLLESRRSAHPHATKHYYSCAPGDAVGSVLGSVKIKRQGGLPVIDQHERLVGIVTRNDLESKEGVVVEDVMTESPISILESDPVTVAVELMSKFEVDTLPVVDRRGAGGKCVGVITKDDVVRKEKRIAAVGGSDQLALLDRESVDM